MSVEIRPARAADLPEAAALADAVFRAGKTSMAAEFPLLFRPQNAGNCVVAFVNGELATFFGVARFVLHIEGTDVPTACVGAVCTRPNFRGRGLAGACMALAEDAAVKRGDVLMPISGGLPLYRRRHAHPPGPWRFLSVPRVRLPKPAGRSFQPPDFDAVAALRATNPVRYRWPEFSEASSVFKSLESFGGTAWVRVAESGKPDAFALLRHGPPMHKDEESISLLEWAGDLDGVLALCAAAAERAERSLLKIRCPWHAADFFERLRLSVKAVEAVEAVEAKLPENFTLKVLNLPRLLELFAPRLRPLHPRLTGEELLLQTEWGTARLRDKRVIHAVLFSKREVWPDSVALSLPPDRTLEPFLPLPVPDYGLCYT